MTTNQREGKSVLCDGGVGGEGVWTMLGFAHVRSVTGGDGCGSIGRGCGEYDGGGVVVSSYI
jgi:hypothetical protein